MEIETLFSSSKWDILRELSKHSYSPLELASRSKTTIANISQQLRLLEAFGLIKKKKISNRDRGKPRTLFSLSENYAYLIATTNGFASKKLLRLTPHHETMLKIWFISNPELHYYAEKFYWKIEPYIKYIDALVIVADKDLLFVVVTNKPRDIKIEESIIKKPGGEQKKVKVSMLTVAESNKRIKQRISPFEKEFVVVYDPNRVLELPE